MAVYRQIITQLMKKSKDFREDHDPGDRKRKLHLKKKKHRLDDIYFKINRLSDLDDLDEFEDE